MRQFRGDDYKKNRTFVIAVADRTVLEGRLNCRTDTLPGFNSSDALIVKRPSGHKELFINPWHKRHRDMQFAFFDALNIYLPAHIEKLYQSDHAMPQSAIHHGLVRAQLIPQPANSTFGAMIEKFRKGRKGTIEYDGLVRGTLADVAKAQGLPLFGNDIFENLNVTVEMLIGSGLAPEKDRSALVKCIDEAMVDLIGDSAVGSSMYDPPRAD
jgi:hypothetical protein